MDSYSWLYFHAEIVMPSERQAPHARTKGLPWRQQAALRTISYIFAAIVFFSATLARVDSVTAQSANPLKYEEPRHLSGTIYTADRKKALFNFSRSSVRTGNLLTVSRAYTYPDGSVAVREKVSYEGDRLREYDVEDLQLASHGSAKIVYDASDPSRSQIFYEYLKDIHSGKKPKTDTEPFRNNCLMGDMVAPFLMDHWSDLLRGNEIKCRYIVVDRRETVGFTFVKDSEARRAGRNVIILKMFPTSRIIAAVIDPLFFTIEKDGQRRILEYTGRVPVKIKDGSKWKDIDGLTVFDWDKP
jgi:hypothetical protein